MGKTPKIAWVIWGLAAFFYCAQYIIRLVPSVIQADLMVAFNMTAKGSGLLGGMFYYPYIAMQMPIGTLVDRFGARVLLTLAAFFCGLSAFLFAFSDSLTFLFISRFLLGFWASAGFVCALKLATVWFPAHLFGTIVGTTQALGMLGASSGGVVLYFHQAYGFKTIFIFLGLLFLVLSALYFLIIRNRPKTDEAVRPQAHSVGQGGFAIKVFTSPYTWINALYAGLIYAPSQVLGEYWGVLFASNAYDISNEHAAWAKSMLFVGSVIGGPAAGMLSDAMGRRPVMLLSAIFTLLCLLIIFYVTPQSSTPVFVLFLILGFVSSGLIAAYAASGELHEPQATGLSMAIANMFSISFGALLIPICGALLDWFTTGAIDPSGAPIYSREECLLSFSVLPLCSLLALFFALFMKETYKKG